MTNHELQQRIAYLVEHGGICDDPLTDIRRQIRLLFAIAGVGCTISFMALLLLIK